MKKKHDFNMFTMDSSLTSTLRDQFFVKGETSRIQALTQKIETIANKNTLNMIDSIVEKAQIKPSTNLWNRGKDQMTSWIYGETKKK
jgi:hypothetical protein